MMSAAINGEITSQGAASHRPRYEIPWPSTASSTTTERMTPGGKKVTKAFMVLTPPRVADTVSVDAAI